MVVDHPVWNASFTKVQTGFLHAPSIINRLMACLQYIFTRKVLKAAGHWELKITAQQRKHHISAPGKIILIRELVFIFVIPVSKSEIHIITQLIYPFFMVIHIVFDSVFGKGHFIYEMIPKPKQRQKVQCFIDTFR